METVGENVVLMQELIHTPLIPPPRWARKWQMEAEHLLHLAHVAKDEGNIARLREIDAEAKRLVRDREARMGGK